MAYQCRLYVGDARGWAAAPRGQQRNTFLSDHLNAYLQERAR
jgi:hypothetical protein